MNDNDRSIISFTVVGHALVHTYELSIPIFITVWLLEFDVTTATIGIIVAIGYALFGIGALPGGILTDSIGSRSIIIACLLGMGASFLLLSVATNVVVIALALAIWGIAASVYHPAGLTLISKGLTNPGRGFGYHGAGGNVGIAFGPLLTAVLLVAMDWRTVALILGLIGIAGAVYGQRLSFEETAPTLDGAIETDGGRDLLRSTFTDIRLLGTASFLLVLGIVIANGLFYRGLLTFLPEVLGGFLEPFADALPEIGPEGDDRAGESFDVARYLYVFLLMVGILGQYYGGILVDRIPSERGLAILMAAVTVVAAAFVPLATLSIVALVLGLVVLGFTMFAIQPLSQATVAKHSPPEVRGLSYGLTYLAVFGVGALGAAIAGIALSIATVFVLFLLLASLTATGCLLAVILVWRGEVDYLDA